MTKDVAALRMKLSHQIGPKEQDTAKAQSLIMLCTYPKPGLPVHEIDSPIREAGL